MTAKKQPAKEPTKKAPYIEEIRRAFDGEDPELTRFYGEIRQRKEKMEFHSIEVKRLRKEIKNIKETLSLVGQSDLFDKAMQD